MIPAGPPYAHHSILQLFHSMEMVKPGVKLRDLLSNHWMTADV